MNYHASFHDAQSALSFMQQQASYIEPQVYETQYPEIQYPDLVPVDTSGDEWAKSNTFYSSEGRSKLLFRSCMLAALRLQ